MTFGPGSMNFSRSTCDVIGIKLFLLLRNMIGWWKYAHLNVNVIGLSPFREMDTSFLSANAKQHEIQLLGEYCICFNVKAQVEVGYLYLILYIVQLTKTIAYLLIILFKLELKYLPVTNALAYAKSTSTTKKVL
jgi:hypothetical protein